MNANHSSFLSWTVAVLILLGTGERSLWLPPALQARALQRRCGIECMANAAAARIVSPSYCAVRNFHTVVVW